MTQAEDFYSRTLVANCVFNAVLSYIAIILNIITIQALTNTSLLPKSLRTSLLSLAVSDLSVGLLVQPLYIARLVMEMEQNTDNNTYNIIYITFQILAYLFSCASFFGVVALSADRFLAIHLHLKYQELVTHKRVVAVVISIWVFCVLVAMSFSVDWIPKKFPTIFFLILGFVCCITTGLLYCKIYSTVRRHTNHIQALHVQKVTPNSEAANAVRLRKTALGTFYMYLVFLACYLPYFCIIGALNICGQSIVLRLLQRFALTLVFLNSCLNPLIYCWKMRYIRHAVIDILRNIFSGHH